MANYLDLAGLTAYDAKLKQWIKSGTVDITDDAIRALFEISAYKMVDLGLSVKWADRNVGAPSPEDAGLYFLWLRRTHLYNLQSNNAYTVNR